MSESIIQMRACLLRGGTILGWTMVRELRFSGHKLFPPHLLYCTWSHPGIQSFGAFVFAVVDVPGQRGLTHTPLYVWPKCCGE